MVQQRIDQCAAGIARSWMHHQAGRFINHDQVGIFKDDIQGDSFRLPGSQFFKFRLDPYLFPAPDLVASAPLLSIHPYSACL